MGKMVLSCFFVVFLCIYTGCEEQRKSDTHKVELQPESSKDSFPAFLVGTWKAKDPDQCKWEFTFEKDGTISSMRNFMDTYIKVSESSAYEKAPDANVDSACALGPVEVNFDPNSRILAVRVVTDYFILHMYDGILEGNSMDKISGPVSQDGLTWNAEWQNFSRMLDGPPSSMNEIASVVFYKVREKDNQPSKGNR